MIFISAEPLIEEYRRRFPSERPHTKGIACTQAAETLGLCRRQLHRIIISSSIQIATADKYCCALGLHPCEVYGEEWFTGEGE